MALPIIDNWQSYFEHMDEGLGSSYERIILNQKLFEIADTYGIESVLEAPSFGFTGISGINSIALAQNGMQVTILDHHYHRLEKIKKMWDLTDTEVKVLFNDDYSQLPFGDDSFDMSWNFSALWFVTNLAAFLRELDRTTKRVILLCVPNRSGLGFISQKILTKQRDMAYCYDNIKPKKFIPILRKMKWELLDSDFIDCPPWPDIGMSKEDFLKKFGLSSLVGEQKDSFSIMEFYRGRDRGFTDKMLSYSWFEHKVPGIIKLFWAHHRYYLFIKKKQ